MIHKVSPIIIAISISCATCFAQYFGSGSQSSTLFFDADGKTYVWGLNYYFDGAVSAIGILGAGDTNITIWEPMEVLPSPGVSHWIGGAFDISNGVYIGDDSNLYFTGISTNESWLPSYFGDTNLYYPTKWLNPSGISGWQSVSYNIRWTKLFLATNGQAYFSGWGADSVTHEPTLVPLPQGVSGWKQIAAGYDHCLLLSNDDKVFAFGRNSEGELGDNSNVGKSKPGQIYTPPGIYKWKGIAAGYYFSLGIDINGKLYYWGRHLIQIGGEFTLNQANKPTPYSVNEIWKEVAIGASGLVLGLTEQGRLYVWGGYDSNIVGLGDGSRRLSEPVLMPLPEGVIEWKDIHVTAFTAFALDQDCRVWAWGYNSQESPIGLPIDSGFLFPRPRIIRQFCLQNAVENDIQVSEDLTVTPNPTASYVEFKIEANTKALEVFDALGRRVAHETVVAPQTQTHRLDVRSYPAGVYFARVGTKTFRIVKQ